ncbi:MAG: hypothetical protein Q7K71_05110 [Candidatus Omnitrophota bacterium]|nr:hypothetical protein [Candidatus Omnitrophota bacterium]
MLKLLQGFWRSCRVFFQKKSLSGQKVKPEDQTESPAAAPAIIKTSSGKLPIHVGIDFGTSCSKACYQIQDGREKVYLIDFKHQLKSFPSYVIPSVLIGDEQNRIYIGEEAGEAVEAGKWGLGLRNFKTLLASVQNEDFVDKVSASHFKENLQLLGLDKEGVGVSEVTSLYVAYMMHRCRDFLKRQYVGRELHINYNVCIPIDYAEDNLVRKDFEKMLAVAQELYRFWEREKGESRSLLRLASELKSQCVYDETQMNVFAIPEAVAELVGYRKSADREAGLYALIDIGSGTTDVSIFRLDRGLKERAVWLSSDAIPMGMYQLEKLVVKALRKQGHDDSLGEVYRAFENFKEISTGLQEDVFLRIRKRIRAFIRSDEYKRPWRSAHIKLRKQRRESLDDIKIVFLAGGGAKIALAKGMNFLFSSSPLASSAVSKKPYNLSALSCSPNLEGALVSDFWRLSVAYGLSFPAPKLGEYKLPKDFPEDNPPSLPIQDWPDRDDTR